MLFLFFTLLLQNISWADTSPLVMSIGEKKLIAAKGDLILGPGKIIKARDLGSKYELEATQAGWTAIRTGNQNYQISVLKQNQFETYAGLLSFTRTSLGLHVQVDQGEISLVGKLTSFDEWQRLGNYCRLKDCRYKSRFEISGYLRKKIQLHFSELFESFGYGSFRLRWEPEAQVMLPGKTKPNDEIEKVVSSYGLSTALDPNAIELAPSIRVQIMILELKKSETQKYGLQWPASYTAQIVPQMANIDKLLLSAQFLEQRGVAKILASPNLLCRSGKESEFLAGGELPIKMMNFKFQDVVWKKYGILLRLKPQADFAGRMSLGIETEISSIDPSHTVDGIPGFYTNRVQSHFDLSEPRTIALSGLIKSEQSQADQGVWGLSRIPILGGLFASHDFQQSRTELVILVRPEIMSAQEEGSL